MGKDNRAGKIGTLCGMAVLAFGFLAGGCQSVPQDEYNLLLQENGELRQRIAMLDSSLRGAEGDADEVQRLAQELAEARRQLEGAQQARTYGGEFSGIPGVSAGRRDTGEIVVAVAGDVLFNSGSTTLKNSAKASLDQVASVLERMYGDAMIRVEGYTDSDPIKKSKWASNEQLSSERAMAVEAYLVGKGIRNDRIYSAAFGSARAKSTKKESRRVEIVILGPGA